ncbi:MAG: ornithine cyclodeaminase family protein [Acidimicrobiia bacterium]|nr:ornithine cyclodeaminase family protein [Acidimicrobiia bacterium]
MSAEHRIDCLYLSQEDLLDAGCLDLNMAMTAAEQAMLAFRDGRIMFPDKIVQIFNDDSQERINCLPATLLDEQVCGMKWVSVFPMNPVKHGRQNLSAVIVLSEIEQGFPIAFMDGTLCSNMRVGAMGGIAAKHFARPDAERIGFIGAGEQAKMHLIAMKTVIPGLNECRVSALYEHEEHQFADEMGALFADIEFTCVGNDGRAAMDGADILVTATSAQAPLLKADWMQPGSFYSHVGGWEDEYAVAGQCDTIVCDDWETVKHRTQTLSRMYQDGELTDSDIAANLIEVVAGDKNGRLSADERVYFNAVGLAYVDVAIAHAMYQRAKAAGRGQTLTLQQQMIFEHQNLADVIRM